MVVVNKDQWALYRGRMDFVRQGDMSDYEGHRIT